MLPIEHGLTCLVFCVGFLIFFYLPLKANTILLLLFFMSGLAIGMHEHIAFQDAFAYDDDIFDDLVVKVNERVPNPWNQALCIFLKNDRNKCPEKGDERWNNPLYFGE